MKKDSNGIWVAVYNTILWGAPIGRTMQPTLAEIVSKQTVSMHKSILLTFFNASIENGTNMIKETSFVINIELKKQTKTSTKTSPRAVEILVKSWRTRISKTARFFKISTKIIIKKSNIIVCQLIYEILGFAKKQEITARISDMENTVSFLKKSIMPAIANQNLHPLFVKEN